MYFLFGTLGPETDLQVPKGGDRPRWGREEAGSRSEIRRDTRSQRTWQIPRNNVRVLRVNVAGPLGLHTVMNRDHQCPWLTMIDSERESMMYVARYGKPSKAI